MKSPQSNIFVSSYPAKAAYGIDFNTFGSPWQSNFRTGRKFAPKPDATRNGFPLTLA